MNIRYDTLISLRIEHNYFTDKFFDAFELMPDEKTKKSIRNSGLLIKKSRNTWYLLYQSKGPWGITVDTLINKEFTFILSIKDDSFAQYTNDQYIPNPKAIEFYAASIDNKLLSSSRFIEPMVFNYSIQHSERPVNITLKKFKGEILKDVAIIEPSTKSYSFDVTATGEAAYDISENTLPVTDAGKREIFVYEPYFDNPFYGIIYFKVFQAASEKTNQYNLLFDKK
jgi:hypothetical protein